MPELTIKPDSRFHLAGVAGVGMSALAQALVFAGCKVSGSDRDRDRGRALDVVRKLELAGVRMVPQDGSGLDGQTAGLVVSTAVEETNPEIQRARLLGIPIIHRAGMLAALIDGNESVAITGTSGKSTVTGMAGWILAQCGRDPTVVNGAPVLNWQSDTAVGNVRRGRTGPWVFEADESDRSLMHFHPDWAVITNISKDHFDVNEAEDLFRRFRSQVRVGTVSHSDDVEAWLGFNPLVCATSSEFTCGGDRFVVPLPGRHNAENAMHAVLLCLRLGLDAGDVRAALMSFKGIHRRLETVGAARGVTVIDDYAHNPAKISAACEAVRPERGRLLAVWQAHGYGPLASMMDGLAEAFARALGAGDRLFLLPVYDAGGTANRSVNAGMLAGRLNGAKAEVEVVTDSGELAGRIAAVAGAGDTVLSMGARDPGLPALARAILEKLRMENGAGERSEI